MDGQRKDGKKGECGSAALAVGAEPLSEPALDEWELDDDWQGIERMLAQLETQNPSPAPRLTSSGAAEVTSRPSPRRRAREAFTQLPRRPSWPAWVALSVGLAVFACGGVLVGWSFAAERADLWSLGMPLSLAGQIVLTLGVLMQLEHLGHSHRAAVAAISELDEALQELRH